MKSSILLIMTLLTPLAVGCYHGGSYNYHRARARSAQLRRDIPPNNLSFGGNVNANFDPNFDYCSGYNFVPYTALELRSSAILEPLLDIPELTIQDGGRLTCSFDNPNEFCSWHNVPQDHLRIWKAKYDVPFDRLRFECTTPRRFNFDGGFLMAGGEHTMGSQKAAIETEIQCLYEDSILKFDIWSNSDDPIARFCIIQNVGAMECQNLLPAPNPMNLTIRQSADPFRLRLELLNLNAGAVVLLDNIYFEGRICELVPDNGDADPETTEDPNQPTINVQTPESTEIVEPTTEDSARAFGAELHEPNRVAIPLNTITTTIQLPTLPDDTEAAADELTACEALTCNFNEYHSCFYGLSGIGSTAPWISAHQLVGNRHTGIQRINLNDPNELGYVYIGETSNVKKDSETFVMESPKFTLKNNIYMVFDMYLRSKGPTLKVCLDSFDYCPYKSAPLDAKQFWIQNQKVFIPPGIRKLYFLAENLQGNHFLAVDNIRVEAEDGSDICEQP